MDECYRQDSTIKVPDFPILQKLSNNEFFYSILGLLSEQIPDYLEENQREKVKVNGQIQIKIPVGTVRQWVEETFRWKERNPETYQERIDGFKAALSGDINRQDEYFADTQPYRMDWMKRHLKIDKILKTLNPGIDIDGILKKIDMTKCPAVDLYWGVREKRMKSIVPPNNNDVDDYIFLPVVPYADVVLIEKQLRHFILQADKNLKSKVFSKATEAMKFLKNYPCGYQ